MRRVFVESLNAVFHGNDAAIAVLNMALFIVLEVLHLVLKFLHHLVDNAEGFLYVFLDDVNADFNLVE